MAFFAATHHILIEVKTHFCHTVMQKTIFVPILATFLLSGCAISPEAQRSALSAAAPCCRAISEIPITDVLGVKESIDITPESPVFDFSTGRSHFASFALSDNSKGKKLELRTFIGGPTTAEGRGAHICFFPAVTYLNDKHEPLGIAFEEQLAAQLYGWSGRGSFFARVSIPDGARYAILHTMPRKIGEFYTGYTRGPGFTMMIKGAVISNPAGEGPMRAVWVSTGSVMVSVQ